MLNGVAPCGVVWHGELHVLFKYDQCGREVDKASLWTVRDRDGRVPPRISNRRYLSLRMQITKSQDQRSPALVRSQYIGTRSVTALFYIVSTSEIEYDRVSNSHSFIPLSYSSNVVDVR